MRLPRQGEAILFIPRVPQGRQPQLTGFITRVWDAEKGDIDIACLRGHEVVFMEHVAPMTEAVKLHCWTFVDGDLGGRVHELEGLVETLTADMHRMVSEVKALKGAGRASVAAPERKAAARR